MHLDFEDGIKIEIEDEIEFEIDEVEIEDEIEVEIDPPKLISKIDKVIIVEPEDETGTGRFNISANDDGVSVDVNEEVIGVILDDAELDEEEQEEVKKEVQRKINTKAIRRDGWLDDVDNKR